MEKEKFLKSKIRVGSIHSKLEYDRLEKVFHADDIPQTIKDRVNAVNEMKQNHDPQSKWSKSTYLLKPENEGTIPSKYTLNPCQSQELLSTTNTFTQKKFDLDGTSTMLKSVSLNNLQYKDEKLRWGTTDIRDLYTYDKLCKASGIKNKWDSSTIFKKLDINEIDENENRNIYFRHLNRPNTKKYLTPQQRQEQRLYQMRKRKDLDRRNHIKMLQREKIEKRLSLRYKRSTIKVKPFTIEDKENLRNNMKEKIDKKYTTELLKDYLESMNDENGKFNAHSLIRQRLIELMMNKRNRMYTTRQLLKIQERRKYDIIRDYFHNGTFSEKLGGWTCCMNSNQYSQGCQVRTINTAKWQTLGV